jgi:hypothetical protein
LPTYPWTDFYWRELAHDTARFLRWLACPARGSRIISDVSIDFQVRCPKCNDKLVTGALKRGSLENKRKDAGDVIVGHATNDPLVGDHTWILADPQVKANLRKRIDEGFFGVLSDVEV